MTADHLPSSKSPSNAIDQWGGLTMIGFWAAGGRLENRRSSIHEQANNRDEALRTMMW